jgi:hypothetical protein
MERRSFIQEISEDMGEKVKPFTGFFIMLPKISNISYWKGL